MADRFVVQINFPVLLANITKADKSREWNETELKLWLKEEGFIQRPDGWLCEEISLALLDPTEVISQRAAN